jgi:hypothetical protein
VIIAVADEELLWWNARWRLYVLMHLLIMCLHAHQAAWLKRRLLVAREVLL